MTSINPINVNTQGIGAKVGFGAKPKAETEKEHKAEVSVGAEKAPVSPDKVLDFLSASSIAIAPKKAIDPAKHVDAASKARIESFMASFEDKVAEGLKAFDKEFPGVQVSDAAKMNVVLKQVGDQA